MVVHAKAQTCSTQAHALLGIYELLLSQMPCSLPLHQPSPVGTDLAGPVVLADAARLTETVPNDSTADRNRSLFCHRKTETVLLFRSIAASRGNRNRTETVQKPFCCFVVWRHQKSSQKPFIYLEEFKIFELL